MINLMNDYNYTAHPRVIDALREAAENRYVGYGLDEECFAAAGSIRGLIGLPDADVFFLPSGTITNLTALAAFLRPHEAVIAPVSAHICMHETGAVEATGHKVVTVVSDDGKARPEVVRRAVLAHTDEHMVKPRLLYISQTTELGTVYGREEMRALRDVCDECGLFLFIDGARLGHALESPACDFTLPEIASFADIFYIGGTKNGLLFGEALVICDPALTSEFRYLIKQRGGLMSKGFLLGIQFRAILEDGLYFELARHANAMAALLSDKLAHAGVQLLADTVSNQVFLFVDDGTLRRLQEHVLFEVWAAKSERGTPIRFVTTWKTTLEEIEAVMELL